MGTFAQLETADPTTMAKAPVVNFCNTKTSVGSIALNGANSYIQRLNITGGSTLGGNIKEFRVQNTMQINTDTSVKGGRLLASNVSFSALLDAAHDAAFWMRLTTPQPLIEAIHRSIQAMNASQRGDALHQLCVATIEGDEAMRGVVSSVLQTWMMSEKLEYKTHCEMPLSVDENSRGFLAFLVEYSFLLIAAQLKANVDVCEIVSLSSLFGDCLQHLSIDSQSKWIHFLLQGWATSAPLLSDCFGFVLAGIRWPSLK